MGLLQNSKKIVGGNIDGFHMSSCAIGQAIQRRGIGCMIDFEKYKFMGLVTKVEKDFVHVLVVDPKTGVSKEEILDRKTLSGPEPEPRDEIWSPRTTSTEEVKPSSKKAPAKKRKTKM
jgi:hypothetical protein